MQPQLAILAMLTLRERAVLILQAEGRSSAEIGQQCGITARAVESRLLRARRKLRGIGIVLRDYRRGR